MADILSFIPCNAHLSEESARQDMYLAEAQYREAQKRPMFDRTYPDYINPEIAAYYRFTAERVHEARRWLQLARNQAVYGA